MNCPVCTGYTFNSNVFGVTCATCGAPIPTEGKEEQRRPDLELAFDTEPIIGWRVWRIVPFQRRGGVTEQRLGAIGVLEHWTPGERAEARCSRPVNWPNPRRLGFHEAPWPDCQCGVWALRTRADAERKWAELAVAACIGKVALWGRVLLEFAHGYRAQYAYPQELIFLGGDGLVAKEIGTLYGVPVRTVRAPEKQPANPMAGMAVSIGVGSWHFRA